MLTGQVSSQALQVVQAQTSSAVIRSSTEPAEIVISESTVTGGGTFGEAGAALPPPAFRTILRGAGGLPLFFARHTPGAPPPVGAAAVALNRLQGEASNF